MNYPLGMAILGLPAEAGSTRRRSTASPTTAGSSIRSTGRRSASGCATCWRSTIRATTEAQYNLIGSHDAPRPRTRPRRRRRGAPARDAAPAGAARARRRSTTATSSAMEGGPDPDCRRGYPADAGRGGARDAVVRAGGDPCPARPPARSGAGRSPWRRRAARRSRSHGRRTGSGRSSRSTAGGSRRAWTSIPRLFAGLVPVALPGSAAGSDRGRRDRAARPGRPGPRLTIGPMPGLSRPGWRRSRPG